MAQHVHAPSISWPTDEDHAKARLADVADRLVLEILVTSFYRSMALQVAGISTKPDSDVHIAMLTWPPDPWSLVHLLGELVAPSANADQQPLDPQGRRIVIAYPGNGLRVNERVELEQIAQAMLRFRGGNPTNELGIEFIAQERLESGARAGTNITITANT